MKKDNDTIKVSSESKLQLPLANLIGIILKTSVHMILLCLIDTQLNLSEKT